MNPQKAEKLFSLMKKHGVEYFKTEKLEIKMGVESSISTIDKPIAKKDKVDTKKIPLQAVPPAESAIPHHVNEVANLLKLNDNDLVDKLFPDFTQPQPQKVGE